ncbi:MAG TPA: DUF2461 domain-containing protein [Spirochaetota bacterium]|nr:DUF2461 domain-containing protein [Spirochaetota bacterium]HOD13241.1 DUF2461 domain-containing protein [Spirochaetota bacterium]HPG48951.1 DUF2461 domain-containing protein [Spirochaetota bacterium]HPN10460.1 DUF2461 domain-containing protein [Spirochaetota bacterium]
MADEFNGFPVECFKFYRELEKNNSKQWFEQHRADYEEHVLGPARRFVTAMGDKLARLCPGIHAEPMVDRSIFRIYRDVRFSSDKRPFKTNLALWFWEGSGKRMESSGFYLHLEPASIMLGVGMYIFPKEFLKEYRDSVVHPRYGQQLARAVQGALKKGDYELWGEFYKKVPRGYPADHKNAELLLFNGLWAGVSSKVPKEAYSPAFVDYCYKSFADLHPVHRWLYEMTRRVG